MLKEDLFSEAGKQTLLEYLPFNLAADGVTRNESDRKGNGDSEKINPMARVKAKALMTDYWWFAYDVIKNMIMQIMINKTRTRAVYQICKHLDQRKQSYRQKNLENFL